MGDQRRKRTPPLKRACRMILGAAVVGWLSGSLSAVLPTHSAPSKPLELVYVANSGALIISAGHKVLIDALFDKPNPDYRAPSPEVLEKIMSGAPPFDGMDLVLVTHNHPDHFDAKLAARYMEACPQAVLAAPADATAELRKAAADWAKIEPRVVSFDLAVGKKESREIKGIPVTACRTLHSGDGESPMNLMYDFVLDGRRVFHEGDTNSRIEAVRGFGLEGRPLDLALVHYWFPLEPNFSKFLLEDLKPEHVAMTHLPVRLEGDAPAKIDMVRKPYKDIFLLLYGMPARILSDSDSKPAPPCGTPRGCHASER